MADDPKNKGIPFQIENVFFATVKPDGGYGEVVPIGVPRVIQFEPPASDEPIEMIPLIAKATGTISTEGIVNHWLPIMPPFFRMIISRKDILGRWAMQSRTRQPRLPLRAIRVIGWTGDVNIEMRPQ